MSEHEALIEIAKLTRLEAWAFNELAAKVYHIALDALEWDDDEVSKVMRNGRT